MTQGTLDEAGIPVLTTFRAEVVAVADVHPHLRRLTFGRGDLADFTPVGPDTFLYLLLPPPGRTELGVDHPFTWAAHAQLAPADQPVGAYYTVRTWHRDRAEIDVLAVLHHHGPPAHPDPDAPTDAEPPGGHASAWVARAQVGDRVALWGPRTAYEPPDDTDHLLLVGDDTALPAIAAILEHRPPGVTAHVVAEVDAETERQALPVDAGVTVTWTYRRGAPTGTGLLDAVRALPALPARTYVWGGGESRALTAVRRHVRDDRGLPPDSVALIAYWRRA